MPYPIPCCYTTFPSYNPLLYRRTAVRLCGDRGCVIPASLFIHPSVQLFVYRCYVTTNTRPLLYQIMYLPQANRLNLPERPVCKLRGRNGRRRATIDSHVYISIPYPAD